MVWNISNFVCSLYFFINLVARLNLAETTCLASAKLNYYSMDATVILDFIGPVKLTGQHS